jgi:ABC-type transport system involved in multi-copper enzyme maturation permease subunit
MGTALINFASQFFSLSWLTGPIFDKELRVSSRRRRNYVLRSAYLLLLTIFIASAWLSTALGGSGGSVSYRISRMGEVGKNVILAITWFQFFAAQLLAVVMLSNSISDEIRRGTLDVLMTTPINSFQIVMGKLFSRLLQLILLLGITLPLLAAVRVFGGMQWDYLVSTFSITFTAMLFAGSLTMLLSIKIRRPYFVILVMLILLIVAYSFASLQAALFGPTKNIVIGAIMLTNPAAAMMQVTYLTFPGFRGAGTSFSWPFHCFVMVCASTVVLLASVLMIRRGAMRRFYPNHSRKTLLLVQRIFRKLTWSGKSRSAVTGSIRPIKGSAIIWKELGRPFSASFVSNAVVFVVLSLPLFLMYYLGYQSGGRGGMMLYSIFTMGLWLIASVRTAVMAATCIAREKEARTWPILLCTTLDDWQIIRGKAAAVLWRNLPLWSVLAANSFAIFIFMRMFGRWGGSGGQVFYYIISGLFAIVAYAAFLIGAGLYFSARLKSTTAAVISTIGSALGLFIVHRFLFSVVVRLIMMTGFMMRGFGLIILYSFVPSILYLVAGLLLTWRAKCRLRQNIF